MSDPLNLPPSLRLRHLWPIEDKLEDARRQRSRKLSTHFLKYQSSPQFYAAEVLGATLTPDQSTMLSSILKNRRTIVKASHAVGKTFVAAIAASWWFDCWPLHITYITAPTWAQAIGLTFKQLKSLRRAKQLPGSILDTGMIRDEDKNTEGAHYIRALNAERGEGFQGEHSAPILIIIEEGVGVPKYIWDAAGGLMTHPDSRMFIIGNPTDEATEFGTASESAAYHTLSISALDHPNIKAELQCLPPPFPDAVRLQWLYEMLEKECDVVDKLSEDAFEFIALPEIKHALEGQPATQETCYYLPTAYFQGRVLGEFPTQADQQVIPKSWLRNQAVLQPANDDMPELGCDVARFGDDRTTVFVRRGPCLLKGREIRKMDTVEVATALQDEALEAARNWKPSLGREAALSVAKKLPIKIDVTGGLGTGPFDMLKAKHYNVIAVNSSERANNPEQYRNRRSELWFDTRERAKDKRLDLSRLRRDLRERLERELSAPKYKAPGQKVVEEKSQMKIRLGYSPDLADGVNLAFAPPDKPRRVLYA